MAPQYQAPRSVPQCVRSLASKSRGTKALRNLRQAGLHWIAVDEDAYTEEGLKLLREQLGNKILSEKRFSDGTGVLLMELSPAPVLATSDE